MKQSPLGRTGLTVSRLGFGAMRLPMDGDVVDRDKTTEMVHYAFEHGVTYIDTAVMYCSHDSQRAVGDALKGWRDKVTVSTKNHYFGDDESAWRSNLDDSLERLQVNCIDVYNTHGMNPGKYSDAFLPRVHGWLLKAKEEGLISHICSSFHGTPELMRRMVDDGHIEAITLQYNLLDRRMEDEIAYAHENGVGIVVMGPVGGGRFGAPSPVLAKMIPGIERVPELALRFVLANPNVDVVLSGMSTLEQVQENVAVCSDDRTLADDELADIDAQTERLKEMAKLYCTGCRYCMPCPRGVNIPRVFDTVNTGRVYGLWDHARDTYRRWLKQDRENNRPANACVECGQCEPKCPQDIPIMQQLRDAHEALAQD